MRALRKPFGIQADEAVIAQMVRNPKQRSLRVRITLQDLTDYGANTPDGELAMVVEGEFGRKT